jgi:Tetratricopeptide repeat
MSGSCAATARTHPTLGCVPWPWRLVTPQSTTCPGRWNSGPVVLTAQQARLGADHPSTLVAANNLGCYLRCLGRLPEALRLTDDTLQAMYRRLGDNHPLALSCSVNLASCLASSGDLAPAMSLQRETAARLADALGAGHPDTLVCEANLAVTLHEAGHEAEAAEKRAWALGEFSHILGPGHPDAARLQNWQWINRDLEPQMI